MARKPTRDIENIQITRTPSGATSYRVRVRARGKSLTKSFTDLDEARRWRNRVKEDVARGGQGLSTVSGPISKMRVAEFINRVWWEEYARPELAEKTRKNYASHIKKWILPSPIAGIAITQVDAEHVHEWQDWCRARGAGESSLRTALKIISSAFSWGAKRPRRTGIKGNPVTDWPAERRSHQVVIVDQEVIERLRQSILTSGRGDPRLRQRDALVLSLMAQTGMRPGEARALQVHDVAKDTIELIRTKTDRPRSVPLWRPLAEDIDAWVTEARLSGSSYLLQSREGEALTDSGWNYWIRNAWYPAREEVASLPEVKDPRLRRARVYDVCRHSYAAQQLAAFVPLPELAAILGHSPAVLSQHYAAVMPKRDEPLIDPEQAVIDARARIAAEKKARS